jgi:ABC-type phosphate/phosphonate transport system ATPase subunit
MDGVTSAATVLSVIQTAWQAYTLCKTYFDEVKEARKVILHLRQEVTSLDSILTNVSRLAEGRDPAKLSSVRLLMQEDGPVLLDEFLPKLDPGKGKNVMTPFGMRALKWPFISKDIEKVLTKIGQLNATLTMALAADNM